MSDWLRSPLAFLQRLLGEASVPGPLAAYESWWESEGRAISDATDRQRTPWLRMFDRFGARVDEILYPPEYWSALRQGYRSGVLWRSLEEHSLLYAYLSLYLTSFYDPGLACPHTVSLATAVSLAKYGDQRIQDLFLKPMLRKDGSAWQGATWMTEIKGGSDLGATVETVAVPAGPCWLLNGEKYFASNVGAEVAVVAARPQGAPAGVRGLALFVVPRLRADGGLNYFIRRIKDKIATRSVPTGEVELRASEAHLLGAADSGIYLILEALNISRVANSMGSVALAQRALSEALLFAEQRTAFGRPVIQHPLLGKQFAERQEGLRKALALAWEAVQLLDQVWQQRPPYAERYHLFRLVAHLAKYWTAEFAIQTAKWAMEVHGGTGVLEEYRVERWLREAMILAIWEGTSHRQVLDGVEVMERRAAHRLLGQHLAPISSPTGWRQMQARLEDHLHLPAQEKEAGAETIFAELAQFTATTLLQKYPQA